MRVTPALFLLPLAAALPRHCNNSDSTYDYIIVGGGTSGLVLANRLSENPAVSVLVIEAGPSVFDNDNVTDPNGYGKAFGTDIDWAFSTVPQAYANGQPQVIRSGKALGGSSTINGMSYARAQADQIDSWGKLGNTGWNWNMLFYYYLKSEHFQVPSHEQAKAGHLTWDLPDHGLEGPVKTGWTYGQANTSFPSILNSTFESLNVPWNEDINGGQMVGFTVMPHTIDRALNIRADAARAYYFPYKSRSNLHVLLNTHVSQIIWKASTTVPTALGVLMTSSAGSTSAVYARKEVILSAGALVSPLILELSGIGNPTILSNHGIKTVVNLPSVGENLHDQTNNGVGLPTVGGFTVNGTESYVAYPSAARVLGDRTEAFSSALKAALPSYAVQVAQANGNATSAETLLELFEIQYDLMYNTELPAAEIIFYQSNGAWQTQFWSLLPFSRGSVHISNSNSTTGASINPNYFLIDGDMLAQIEVARFVLEMFSTPPFSMFVDTNGVEGVISASDSELENLVRQGYRSNFHSIGSTAMLPRDKGGVVDAEMKVYGTANVRVMDAGVLPTQVCGHLAGTLYAMAERVADLIKAG